jgi:hypothetical protein
VHCVHVAAPAEGPDVLQTPKGETLKCCPECEESTRFLCEECGMCQDCCMCDDMEEQESEDADLRI